jgi:hypothetical protein
MMFATAYMPPRNWFNFDGLAVGVARRPAVWIILWRIFFGRECYRIMGVSNGAHTRNKN